MNFKPSWKKRKAVRQLSSGKAPGTCAIPAEVYKVWYCQFDVSPVNYSDSDSEGWGLPVAEKLTELSHCMWRKEAIHQEFKAVPIILLLYKRKGNIQAVTTTEASLSYQSPGRYWQNSVAS